MFELSKQDLVVKEVERARADRIESLTRFSSRMRRFAGMAVAAIALVSMGASQQASAQTFTTLHNFSGTDGGHPYANLTMGRGGVLYGTTFRGGLYNDGAVFKVDASTGKETVIFSFSGPTGDNPEGGLIMDSKGNLYGTTLNGGAYNDGAVFKLNPSTKQETVIHSFAGLDGLNPFAAPVIDAKGNLYGTTNGGGAFGDGVVYKIDASTGKETVVYSFFNVNGSYPRSGLIIGRTGNLYGTTLNGGAYGSGVVYKLNPSTGAESVLYNFTGAGGKLPEAKLLKTILGSAAQKALNSGSSDGGFPYSGLILDSAGNLYGTTVAGGNAGAGTLYEIDCATGVTTILHSFTGADGAAPRGTLIMDSAGNLYGTTIRGGAHNDGVVFEFNRATRKVTVLHSFSGPDGKDPNGGLILDGAHTLYGTTERRGAYNYGTVFKIALSH